MASVHRGVHLQTTDAAGPAKLDPPGIYHHCQQQTWTSHMDPPGICYHCQQQTWTSHKIYEPRKHCPIKHAFCMKNWHLKSDGTRANKVISTLARVKCRHWNASGTNTVLVGVSDHWPEVTSNIDGTGKSCGDQLVENVQLRL